MTNFIKEKDSFLGEKPWRKLIRETINSILSGGTGGGGTITSVTGTLGRITVTPGSDPVIDIDPAYAAGYWKAVSGTPTRVGNTSFTITDTANANLYNKVYSRTTILKWTDVGVTKMAMVADATYGVDTVTVTIMGDTLTATATMSSFTYSSEKCFYKVLAFAGTVAIGNNLTAKLDIPCEMKPFGVDGRVGTAGTTNATTVSLSKNAENGTASILAADLSIASGATKGKSYAATSGTTLAEDDYLVVNVTGVSTTAPIDLYVYVYMTPLNNKYL